MKLTTPEPLGDAASLLVQLARPPQIAEQDRHPRQVGGRRTSSWECAAAAISTACSRSSSPLEVAHAGSAPRRCVFRLRARVASRPSSSASRSDSGPSSIARVELVGHHQHARRAPGARTPSSGEGPRSSTSSRARSRCSTPCPRSPRFSQTPAEARLRLGRGLDLPGPEETARVASSRLDRRGAASSTRLRA